MPQILKDDLRKRILEAAGSIFAERGFEAARIADIADIAGTSASNVYKYVKDKTDLFDKVLPAPLVSEHRRLLSARLGEFEDRRDWRSLDAGGSSGAGNLLAFWVAHRHAAGILMGNAAGTPYAQERPAMIAEMTGRAVMRLGRPVKLPIEVQVSDNGPGVDPALRDHIFEPFVSSKKNGQGLGLALVNKLVRDMDGRISHERDEAGGWTHFRVHLPVAR